MAYEFRSSINKTCCKAAVYPKDHWGSFHPHQCNLKIWKDGWCKIHHPDIEHERHQKREEESKKWLENSPSMKLIRAKERIDKLVGAMLTLADGCEAAEADCKEEVIRSFLGRCADALRNAAKEGGEE